MTLEPIVYVTCSALRASLGIQTGAQDPKTLTPIFYWIENDQNRPHSDFLNEAFQRLLVATGLIPQQVKKIVCDHGPGSFTGVRVAVSFARTLAFALQVPIETFSSLGAMGGSFFLNTKAPSSDVGLLALNAFRQSIYVSVLPPLEAQRAPVELWSYSAFESWVLSCPDDKPVWLFGDVLPVYRWSPPFLKKIQIASESSIWSESVAGNLQQAPAQVGPWHRPHVMNMFYYRMQNMQAMSLTPDLNWQNFTPYYLRLSSAEEVLLAKVSGSMAAPSSAQSISTREAGSTEIPKTDESKPRKT